MKVKNNARSLIKLSALLCANAWATDPQSIKLAEGVSFTPTLEVSERYDDNFRQVEHGTEASWITRISPGFAVGAETSKYGYKLAYRADSDIFHDSTKDNNTDHYLDADAMFNFDSRNRLKLGAGYQRVEETATLDQRIENDKYTVSHAGATYTYGAKTARGQIEVGGDYAQLRYQNGQGLNNDKERNTTALVSTFYYRVAPRTRALLEGRYTDYNYVSNTRLDSTKLGLLGGLEWEATAKTTGTIKIGAERKEFDTSGVKTASGSLWEVGAKWKPRTYSTFELKTHQALVEGDDGASSIKQTAATLAWEHYWLTRLSTTLRYTRSDEDYQDTNRSDKINGYGLAVKYEFRRWMDVTLSLDHVNDDSTEIDQSYRRNIYLLSFAFSL
jgi:hypothetical protein